MGENAALCGSAAFHGSGAASCTRAARRKPAGTHRRPDGAPLIMSVRRSWSRCAAACLRAARR